MVSNTVQRTQRNDCSIAMKKLNELGLKPSMQEVLTAMIESIGLTVNDIDFSDKEWFTKHTWTEKEQKSFVEWLIVYLKDPKHLKEIARWPRITKSLKQREKLAWEIILNYGWRCTYDA